VGVLVMAHGTPDRPEDIEAFYTRIRRGSPPSPAQLEELVGRYQQIGGVSPLARRTAAQVDGLAALLEEKDPGRYVVAYGAKHTDPAIETAAGRLAASGVSRVVGLVLAPHRSSMGSGEYFDRAAAALGDTPFVPLRQWYDAPGFPELMAERVRAALDGVDGDRRTLVVFTAHSLPERVRAAGDPYPDQMDESAALIAGAAGLETWQVAWQSAGRTPEPWIGPDILEVLRGLPAEGYGAVVVCPVGFVSDHLEVLYDLDFEARAVADQVGLAFTRTASLNDDPAFLAVLGDAVVTAADADLADGGR